MNSQKYQVIGLMSGTSLDGLDVAGCSFEKISDHWKFSILYADTITYPVELFEQLKSAHLLSSFDLRKLDTDLGHFFGLKTADFIRKYNLKPDLVASHGHTIFHKPDLGFTLQIGDGPAISTYLDCPLVFDFRSKDLALGGQGAPLVPIGDHLLFSEYDACINLGGFANISYVAENRRIAYDICPVNFVLNHHAQSLGFDYDRGGELARSGNIDFSVLHTLNNLDFYSQQSPKSLGREWVEANVSPILQPIEARDVLATFTKHIAMQISQIINQNHLQNVLFTGGGTKNDFLMQKISEKTQAKIQIPSVEIIDFKEALIFAFLGLLRYRNEINVLSSVTGAKYDHSAGSIVI